MKVNIHEFNEYEKTVLLINEPVGVLRLAVFARPKKWRFEWAGEHWKTLTYDEAGAVLEGVKKPLALLNITQRLKS